MLRKRRFRNTTVTILITFCSPGAHRETEQFTNNWKLCVDLDDVESQDGSGSDVEIAGLDALVDLVQLTGMMWKI